MRCIEFLCGAEGGVAAVAEEAEALVEVMLEADATVMMEMAVNARARDRRRLKSGFQTRRRSSYYRSTVCSIPLAPSASSPSLGSASRKWATMFEPPSVRIGR